MQLYLHFANDGSLDDMLASHTLKLQVKKLISYVYPFCISDINVHHWCMYIHCLSQEAHKLCVTVLVNQMLI